MRSAELKRAKRRVRREVLAARDAMSPGTRSGKGRRIADRFLDLPEVAGASTVMLFWSFGSEVPTEGMIERLHVRGVTIVLPRIEGSELVPVRFAPGQSTTATSFGAREPAQGEPIPPADLDVVGVPGVAFDRGGRRIGYGAGYYDRLLPRATSASAIGLAFEVQVVDGDLPAGGADVRVDLIVTESETIRPALDLNSRSRP